METPESFKSELDPEARAQALEQISQMEAYIKTIEEQREALSEAIESGDTEKQEEISKLLKSTISKAKSLKRIMEGETSQEISAEYNHDGKIETIELNFEKEVDSMIDLYEKHSIPLPKDFKEQMQTIWENNTDSIREAIKEKGFNKLLFIPENLPKIKDLAETMTEGYDTKGNKTNWGTRADSITEEKTKTRLILVHDTQELTDQPELKKTLNKTAEDFIKEGQSMTLSEYLILQRDIFEKTGKHLDEKKYTWLPGSKSGSRVVRAGWHPDYAQLDVDAHDAGDSSSVIGCRLSRSFF